MIGNIKESEGDRKASEGITPAAHEEHTVAVLNSATPARKKQTTMISIEGHTRMSGIGSRKELEGIGRDQKEAEGWHKESEGMRRYWKGSEGSRRPHEDICHKESERIGRHRKGSEGSRRPHEDVWQSQRGEHAVTHAYQKALGRSSIGRSSIRRQSAGEWEVASRRQSPGNATKKGGFCGGAGIAPE